MRHLLLRLEAPMMAFGGETIDNLGVIRWFPSLSMLTGLLANALGWRRTDRERHQRLQDRLVFAARIDREPSGRVRLGDFQTAQLEKNDRGWTTRGSPEGRDGGPNTYAAPHLRYRDYFSDMEVTIALRMEAPDEAPTIDELARALEEPARPLFIGRKPCLPSGPLFNGFQEGETALAALKAVHLGDKPATREPVRALWPAWEGTDESANTHMLTDQRNWVSGLHGGGRLVCEGEIAREDFAAPVLSEHTGDTQ